MPPRELFKPNKDILISKPPEPAPLVPEESEVEELDEDILQELEQAMEVQEEPMGLEKEDITPSEAILKYRLK